MADGAKGADASMWMVEPPGAGQVHIAVGMGEGVQMTPEVKATIERFMSAMMSTDAAAVAPLCGGAFTRCSTFSCSLDECKPLKSAPCVQLVSCRIDST